MRLRNLSWHINFGRIAILIAAGGWLSACSAVKDAYVVDSVTRDPDAEIINDSDLFQKNQYAPPAFDVYRAPYPGDINPTGVKVPTGGPVPTPASVSCIRHSDGSYWLDDKSQCRSAYVFAMSETNGGTRNALMGFLIRRSDDICHLHEAGIISTGTQSNFALSELSTVLAGLGGLLTPASTVRALSGSAALVSATRDNFNQVFFQNLLSSAVVKSIESTRAQKRTAVLSNASKTNSEYSVDQMLTDLLDYHQSCSFYAGIVTLTDAAGRVTRSADEISNRIALLQQRVAANMKSVDDLNEAKKKQGFKEDSPEGKAQSASVRAAMQSVATLQAQIALLETQLMQAPGSPAGTITTPAVAASTPPATTSGTTTPGTTAPATTTPAVTPPAANPAVPAKGGAN